MGKKIDANEFIKDYRPAPKSIIKYNSWDIGRVLPYDVSTKTPYIPILNLGTQEKEEILSKDAFVLKGKLNCSDEYSLETTIYRIKRELNKYTTILKVAPNVISDLSNELSKLETKLKKK